MGKAVKLKTGAGGRLVSRRSKTGNPACSAATSAWVRSRHGGPAPGPEVYKVLARCRQMAAQNRRAKLQQESGKLAEGRGTWDRSDKARELLAGRAAARPQQAPPAPARKPNPLSRDQRVERLVSLAGGRARHLDAGAKIRDRDRVLDRRDKLRALLAKPGAESSSTFALDRKAAPRPFGAGPGAGSTKPLFGDMRGAAARDLAGQRTFAERPSLREQAAAHRASKGSASHRADVLSQKAAAIARKANASAKRNLKEAKKRVGTAGPVDKAGADKSLVRGNRQAERSKAASERYRKIHEKYFPADRPWPSSPKAEAPAPAAPKEMPLDQFARHAVGAARESRTGWFGDAKVFSSHVWQTLKHEPAFAGMDEATYKRMLLAAHRGRHLELGRADLVEAMDQKDLKASAIPHENVTYHFVRTDPEYAGYTASERKGRERPDLRTKATANAETRAMMESARPREFNADARGRKARAAKKQRAELAKARRDPASHTDHAPGTVTPLRPDLLHVDPARFQYKQAAHSETGSVGSLAGVKKYDENLGGVLQVWKDPANGKVFVVNGHNRLDLARKLGAEKVTTRFLGSHSAEEARSVGALTNIAEGNGTSVDAAKFFRDNPEIDRAGLESRGIPLGQKVATEGLSLSKLSPQLFRRVAVEGSLTPARGAIVGGSGLGYDEQHKLMSLVDKQSKARPITDRHLNELVDTVKSSNSVKSKGGGLFDDEEETSLALHKAKLQADVKERLSREKKLFGTVARSRNANELARGGNSIDSARSGEISRDADRAAQVFDLMKNRTGPIADELNAAAARLHQGHKAGKVTDEAYSRILAHIPSYLQ